MATLLNDIELRKLFGTVIKDADENNLHPNSYILRLGRAGEFMNSRKAFEIKPGKGIKLPPGHAVGVTALEEVDFRQETVEKIYPGCSFYGFLSPTTDLSREGLVTASTQVDAGYHGTLNWTINNHSPTEAKFVYGEKLFRLTLFKLEQGEVSETPYAGDYQDKESYVRSAR